MGTCLYVRRLRRIENIKQVFEDRIQTKETDISSPISQMEMGQPQIQKNIKSVDSAWIEGDNFDGDVTTDLMKEIDDESDSEELEQIKQQIQQIQENAFRKQIDAMSQHPNVIQKQKSYLQDDNELSTEESLEQIEAPQHLFHELPKPVSDIKLGFEQTARLSMDENGVMDLLNAEDQSEIDEYEEGVDKDEEDMEENQMNVRVADSFKT